MRGLLVDTRDYMDKTNKHIQNYLIKPCPSRVQTLTPYGSTSRPCLDVSMDHSTPASRKRSPRGTVMMFNDISRNVCDGSMTLRLWQLIPSWAFAQRQQAATFQNNAITSSFLLSQILFLTIETTLKIFISLCELFTHQFCKTSIVENSGCKSTDKSTETVSEDSGFTQGL